MPDAPTATSFQCIQHHTTGPDMSPNSRILYRLLLVAAGINVLGLPLAIFQSEPWHAAVHAALALACGFGALRLRHRRPDPSDPLQRLEESPSDQAELGAGEGHQFDDEWLKRRQAHDREGRQE